MLKACCDCIAAGIREENEVYGSQMNRHNNMWPKSVRGIVFSLPRQLNIGDEINVKSVFLQSPQWISLSLTGDNGLNEADENNVAGLIELHFPQNIIKLKTVVNGISQSIEPENPEFNTPISIVPNYNDPESTITIKIRISQDEDTNNTQMEFEVGLSFIKCIELQHHISRIKYLKLDGDVEKVDNLQFQFA
ncbi:uncharacterized protein [Epargyreus clarus]|uniref:uncharacterized protein n=1 Tax=Epargyreus clarus TaxID=520877 RepID=UPI003C2CEB8A